MWGNAGIIALCSALSLGCGDGAISKQEPPRAFTLLHTSDIHSRIWPFSSRISRFEAELGLGKPLSLDEVGGAARLATLLESERRRGVALWLDSGDALEGAPVFNRSGGRVELELLGSLGLGAMALGNHELSLSSDELAALFESAPFPVLTANLRPNGDSALFGRVAPSVVLRAGVLRVGVVGASNPQSPPNLKRRGNPWRLELEPDLAGAVQAAIDEVAPRAALVVVLSHLGLEGDQALVRGTSGIDVVLGGHQHILTLAPEWQDDCVLEAFSTARGCLRRRVAIVHSGAYLQWLSRVALTLTPDLARPGELEISDVALKHLPLSAAVAEAPRVADYLDSRRPPPEPPLGFAPEPLPRRSALGGDSPLGNLAADAMLRATEADVVVLNSSALREDLEAGALLRSDLALAFPFAEPWRLGWLTGRALRRGFELAAFRSAARDCVSALQVAGLRLKLRCASCSARAADCLEIRRKSALGDVPLRDDDWLLVALPAYLTLTGADFEAATERGADIDGDVADALGQLLKHLPTSAERGSCATSLVGWSDRRCADAYGVAACPIGGARARQLCESLPTLKGARDGRIEMLP